MVDTHSRETCFTPSVNLRVSGSGRTGTWRTGTWQTGNRQTGTWQSIPSLQNEPYCEAGPMMILPFVFFSGAALAGWRRYTLVSIILWVAGLAAMMAMFRYHVTSSLDLDF